MSVERMDKFLFPGTGFSGVWDGFGACGRSFGLRPGGVALKPDAELQFAVQLILRQCDVVSRDG